MVYAQRYYSLTDEETKIDDFIQKARKGVNKETLKKLKKPLDCILSLADFMYAQILTKEDAVKIFKMRNPSSKLKGEKLEEAALKKITQYPLPTMQNKIRFNRLDQHLELISS